MKPPKKSAFTAATPGPWTVSGYSIVKNSRRHPIADVYMWASNSSGTGPEITKANARLIAQSPMMAETLESVLRIIQHNAPDACSLAIELAKHALAKVNGGAKI